MGMDDGRPTPIRFVDDPDYEPGGLEPRPVYAVDGVPGGAEPGPPAWGDITGKPATFPPTIGTTAATAKAGNYAPTWSEITGKPAVIGAGADAAAARAAIGAGTSNLAIGATASTAAAGNHAHADLEARITALEGKVAALEAE